MRHPNALSLFAAALSCALIAVLAAPLSAATITIINANAPGIGFNDPTAAAPVGGNPGTTIGDQRLNCFKEAARIWGGLLPSGVTINVESTFEALSCSATSAVLGAAGTQTVHANFPGAEVQDIWYPQALANKLSGMDLDTTTNDMRARFNSNLGNAGCLTGVFFYYGLDNAHGDNVDLVAVLLHEFGHGLGFATYASGSTGALFMGMGDIFARNIYDDTLALTWNDISLDSQRKASAINSGNLTFNGPATTTFLSTHLSKRPRLVVTAPVSASGTYEVGTATFGPALTSPGITGTVVQALSGTATDGCAALTNGPAVSGKIAIVDRGTCNFTVKVKNAQNVGALAVLVVDNAAGSPPAGLGGTDATITIPSVRLTQSDGTLIKSNLPATATLGLDPVLLSGGDAAGRGLLYAPNPFQQGSSVSHFDVSATPNLLMEPIINGDLPHGVDATLETLRDEGWFRTPAGGGPTASWFLPSSARAGGAGGAFYTTDLTVGNEGAADTTFTLKFLGHDTDGRTGAEANFSLGAGKSVTYTDVLGSIFSVTSNFGALRVSSASTSLNILGQTSTPGPAGGTFGQSVPVASASDLIVAGTPKTIVAVRDDSKFRTNLILVNTTETQLDIDLKLVAADGTVLGIQRLPQFGPLEMRQVTRVVQSLGAGSATGATLVLSTPTANGAFAAYASVIDNVTNDPRTLLPR